MPYFLLNHRYEIVADGETKHFEQKGYMIVKANSADDLHKPVERKTISAPKVVREWDFSLIPIHERKKVMKLYETENFEKIKAIINRYNVSPTPLCCGDNRKLIHLKLKKAIDNGNLAIQ